MREIVENRVPTRISAVLFSFRAALLQTRRGLVDLTGGVRPYPFGRSADFSHVLAESRTPLWTEERLAERVLQQGKVQNLRCALRRLNGVCIPADGLFSFWRQVGRATRRRGYVPGRQLREGCLYPAIGGGLCQLSNALYDVALRTGCRIVERHAHTAVVPGSAAAHGRDATVAWNYIDLRFRPPQALLLEAHLTKNELVLRLRGRHTADSRDEEAEPPPRVSNMRPVLNVIGHSCHSCGVESCFRHGAHAGQEQAAGIGLRAADERTAYLMDEGWPEFQQYLAAMHTTNDVLGVPLDGARWRRPRYWWDTSGYAHVGAATWQTLWRSLATRRLGKYGARRLEAQLEGAGSLARRLARELTPDITRVCVAQFLLPFLWRDGHLGGRGFDVLMTRLPLQTLHARLDAAFAAHSERGTLGEFRAPEWMVEAEAEALAAADRIITPHSEIASLFPGRALRLDWHMPARKPAPGGASIAFPGPTAARKGAYELREVARALDLEIVLLGSELEGEDFWTSVRTRRVERGSSGDWLQGVAAVAQPALVEERPRPLLAALAAGVPVIATAACGLGDVPGVITIPYGDEDALRDAIRRALAGAPGHACVM